MKANEIEARELSLYATNDRNMRFGMVDSILRNLATKRAKGTYGAEKALKAWERVADYAARQYAKEFCGPGFDLRQFSKATRRLAAQEIAEYYGDMLGELTALARLDRDNKRDWPLSSIKAENEARGFYFFSRDTMRHFGDRMSNFRVIYSGGRIVIERKAGRAATWEFFPATGQINPLFAEA